MNEKQFRGAIKMGACLFVLFIAGLSYFESRAQEAYFNNEPHLTHAEIAQLNWLLKHLTVDTAKGTILFDVPVKIEVDSGHALTCIVKSLHVKAQR